MKGKSRMSFGPGGLTSPAERRRSILAGRSPPALPGAVGAVDVEAGRTSRITPRATWLREVEVATGGPGRPARPAGDDAAGSAGAYRSGLPFGAGDDLPEVGLAALPGPSVERLLPRGIDEEAHDDVQELVARGPGDRPAGGQSSCSPQDFLDQQPAGRPPPTSARRAAGARGSTWVGQAVDVVDPQPVALPLGDELEDLPWVASKMAWCSTFTPTSWSMSKKRRQLRISGPARQGQTRALPLRRPSTPAHRGRLPCVGFSSTPDRLPAPSQLPCHRGKVRRRRASRSHAEARAAEPRSSSRGYGSRGSGCRNSRCQGPASPSSVMRSSPAASATP